MMEGISSRCLAEKAVSLFRLCSLAGRSIDSCKPTRPRANSLYYHVLFMLHSKPGVRLTMSQLAEGLILSKQHLSKLIGSMECKGLVRREHDPVNRRQVYVRILPAGVSMVDEMIAEVHQHIAMQVEVFSEQEKSELQNCLNVFQRLVQKLIDYNNISPVQEDAQ